MSERKKLSEEEKIARRAERRKARKSSEVLRARWVGLIKQINGYLEKMTIDQLEMILDQIKKAPAEMSKDLQVAREGLFKEEDVGMDSPDDQRKFLNRLAKLETPEDIVKAAIELAWDLPSFIEWANDLRVSKKFKDKMLEYAGERSRSFST